MVLEFRSPISSKPVLSSTTETAPDRKSGKKILVDLDYLVMLHDFLRLNLDKMKEMIGGSPSATLYAYSTDNLIGALGERGRAPDGVDGFCELLKGWGMGSRVQQDGATVKLKLERPYADRVHPRLSPSESGCPLGELALGAVRKAHPLAQMVSNGLSGSGASIEISRGTGRRE